MDIVIPTYGRASYLQQHTFRALLSHGFKPILVVREEEYRDYKLFTNDNYLHAIPAGYGVENVAQTRDYIIHHMPGDNKVIMLDDDLDFAKRRTDDRTKFESMTAFDYPAMMIAVSNQLDFRPHVSIAAREGGNRITDRVIFNTRMMRALAYDRDFLKQRAMFFDPTNFMCDFHMTLQLLEMGEQCAVINDYVTNQRGGSNAPGGCSLQRSDAQQTKEANLLAHLHTPFVKVVQKTTKTAWGGKTRDDVIIQWKRAYEHGLLRRSAIV